MVLLEYYMGNKVVELTIIIFRIFEVRNFIIIIATIQFLLRFSYNLSFNDVIQVQNFNWWD